METTNVIAPRKTFGRRTHEESADKREVVHNLIDQSHIGSDYYFLLTVSSLIVTLGIKLDNASVVIGGMLIAPLMSPILALGLGIVTANRISLFRSTGVLLKSIAIVLGISTAVAFLTGVESPTENLEIASRIKPTLPFMYIAILSGIAASYSWARPKLSATLPGISVVVALLPPLSVTGVGISVLSREIITGSFQLFIINLIGIAISSAVVFSLLGFHQMRWVERQEIDLEKEEEMMKKNNEPTVL